MRKTALLVLALVLGTSTLTFAQKREAAKGPVKLEVSFNAKMGDKYLENEEYYLAAEYYGRSLRSNADDVYALYKQGEAYRLFFDYARSEKAYGRANELGGATHFPVLPFQYANMLKMNGKFQEAKAAYEGFIRTFKPTTPEDQKLLEQAKVEAAGCDMATTAAAQTVPDYKFDLSGKPVNSQYSDYAPAIFLNDSNIVITSARPGSKGGSTDPRNGETFSDLYRMMKLGAAGWGNERSRDGFAEINTRLNDGTGVFNKAKNKFYFSICRDNEACKLYVSKLENGKWTAPEILNENVNAAKSSNKQPALTPNSDTLFFVSTREGGKGQNDIWFTTSKGDDNWGPAINLEAVNTPYQDIAPSYYAKENLLLFATNGREGFGGLDVFLATAGGRYADAKNIGLPFNSSRDDFYFAMGENIGYLTSNRVGGPGGDDIYQFKPFETTKTTSLKEALLNKSGKQPELIAKAESQDISGKVVDNKGEPVKNIEVPLKDSTGTVVTKAITDDKGEFQFNNLPNDKKYKVEPKVEKAVANAKRNRKSGGKAAKEVEDEDAEKPVVVKDLKVKDSKKKATRYLFENIYFGFNEDQLTDNAKKALDEVITFAKAHDNAQVELYAHTDNIGTSTYNQALSARRGNAAKQYLIDAGLPVKKLLLRPRGEGKALAPNDNPVGRALNRRVEFMVVGGDGSTSYAQVFVPEKDMTAAEIASSFGMSVDELKVMNNTSADSFTAFTPIRVRREGSGAVSSITSQLSKKSKPGVLPELEKSN